MGLAMTEPRTQSASACPAGTEAPSDAELLQAIAGRRDRAAFEVLYARHKDRVYALLCAILHDSNDALDALQDTFVRVWIGAHSVKHFDRIPAWILRVAAREGVRVIASRRQKKRRSVSLDAAMDAGAQPAAKEATLPDEVVAALREQVGALDPEKRSVVALYFGGNLSQQEIAEALDLSQQSVSHRLNQALEHLRVGLRQAGFAATLPLLEANALPAALTSGHAAPASAWGAIGSKLSTAAEASQRMTAATSSGALILMGVAALIAVGGAGGWLLREQPRGPGSETDSPARQPATETAPAADAGPAPFRKVWTFKSGMPDGMEVVYGRWQLVDYKGHRMLGPLYKQLTLIKLPMEVEARCYRVRVKVWPNPEAFADPQAEALLTVYPTQDKKLGEFSGWHRSIGAKSGETLQEFWILGDKVVGRFNDALFLLFDFDQKIAYDTFYVRTMNWLVREIEVTSVEGNEVPPELLDRDGMIQVIGGEPMRSEENVELLEFRKTQKQ